MRLAAAMMLAPAIATAQVPVMPEPEPAPYVSPRRLIDGLSLAAGVVDVDDRGHIIYDSDAHLRVTLSLGLAERLSDDRAASSWRRGWVRGVSDLLDVAQDERRARFVAEARVEVLDAQLDAAQADSRMPWYEIAGWIGLGLAAGAVAGFVAGWSI